MKLLVLFFLMLLFSVVKFTCGLSSKGRRNRVFKLRNGLSCKDSRNQNVDWFIAYKLPKISNEPAGTSLSKGTAYTYISSTNPGKWKLSSHEITSERSMLGATWKELNKKKQSATYLFYNDDTPEVFKGSAVGHLKGILAFDDKSGYWLSHSIPRFGHINNYEFPDNALTNGQHAICITFKVSELSKICNHLLYAHPNIFLKKITDKVKLKLDEDAKSLFTDKPAFIRSAPFVKKTELKSAGGQEFTSFAKDNQLAEDLFSDIIAPQLKTSLLAETWRRGVGTYLQPSCQTNYPVIHVTAINMTATTRGRDKSIYFKSTEDHSKWAISDSSKQGWICMADMNRMASQERRGGGALCFRSNTVWKEFKNIIYETDMCPTKK